jgi:hypothetical protein
MLRSKSHTPCTCLCYEVRDVPPCTCLCYEVRARHNDVFYRTWLHKPLYVMNRAAISTKDESVVLTQLFAQLHE